MFLNQKNETLRAIRNGLEARRKKLAELEGAPILNNEINGRVSHLKKEIRILERELEVLL